MTRIEDFKSRIARFADPSNVEFEAVKTEEELEAFLSSAIGKKKADEAYQEREAMEYPWPLVKVLTDYEDTDDDRIFGDLYAVACLQRSWEKQQWRGKVKYLDK